VDCRNSGPRPTRITRRDATIANRCASTTINGSATLAHRPTVPPSMARDRPRRAMPLEGVNTVDRHRNIHGL
jgi:hypothetical protein